VLPLVVYAALAAGCANSPEPYETEDGSPTRLDGKDTEIRTLTVSQALDLARREVAYVRGYLFAPRDEATRLCTRLDESGLCGGPSLVLDASQVDLETAPALEVGCCALGLWSPRPLVLRLQVRGRRARVLG
jgi:hypothetical protein